jgi:hypothetical protein
MDDIDLNTNTYNTTPPPKKRTRSGFIWSLVVVVVLVLGGVGGYYYGIMDKDQAVKDAKEMAALEADKAKTEDKKDASTSQKSQTQTKTSTEATCNADELSLKVEQGPDSGAGTLAYDVVMTNIGQRTCVLGGFPGVSLVNDNGNMIGSPAERATNYQEKKLSLAPKVSVKAVASISNSSNFTEGQCKDGATKLRVYPPNDVGYLSAPATIEAWCPGFKISPVLAM